MSKSDIISAVLQSLGEKFADVKTGAEQDKFRHEGAKKQLLRAANNITALTKLVEDDVAKGRIPAEPALIQRFNEYLSRAASVCIEMSKVEARNEIIAEGRAQGVLDLVRIAQKRQEEAEKKKAEQAAFDADPEGTPVPEGRHPGPSLKQQRIAEQAKEDAAKLMKPPAKKAPKKKSKVTRKAVPKKAAGGSAGGKNA